MNIYWPIALIVAANVGYHICAKSVPGAIHPLASLVVTYIIAAIASAALYFVLTPGGSLAAEFKMLNWAPFVLGIVIIGLEVGSIYMYKVGWNISIGSLVASICLAVALILVGILLYHEVLTMSKIIGIVLCLIGLIFINK